MPDLQASAYRTGMVAYTTIHRKFVVRIVSGPLINRNQAGTGCAIAAAAWQLQSGIKGVCGG